MWCSTVGCIVALTLSLLAAPLATEAQQVGQMPRLGILFPAELPSPRTQPGRVSPSATPPRVRRGPDSCD